MTGLADNNCRRPSETTALTDDQISALLNHLPDWKRDHNQIQKEFKFNDYYQTIDFVNAVAAIAHQQDHHPELTVNYNRCLITYRTHSVGGLSENDFICAAKVDAIISQD
ncbi:MAG: 4a-hydroxytetrahydrobiopterin dehydratase [Gammaproteobacteria bacterium]|nr:4a-hydroxytetrahydrobiopterin dehydratase [Gammaproteobacteria bacterium]MDH5778872.1 4a-hydroxytetrahydrobiopterin dehydratase [Gammaproteobacteria bacterium]